VAQHNSRAFERGNRAAISREFLRQNPGAYHSRKFNMKPNVAVERDGNTQSAHMPTNAQRAKFRLLTYKIKYRFAAESMISDFGYFYQRAAYKN
jgi:hypothetical protein